MTTAVKKFRVKRIARVSGVVHEHITIVDADDAHLLRNSFWVAQIDNPSGYVYIVRKKAGCYESLHRVIVGAEKNERVDHINGDTLDNRRSNLLRQSQRVEEVIE